MESFLVALLLGSLGLVQPTYYMPDGVPREEYQKFYSVANPHDIHDEDNNNRYMGCRSYVSRDHSLNAAIAMIPNGVFNPMVKYKIEDGSSWEAPGGCSVQIVGTERRILWNTHQNPNKDTLRPDFAGICNKIFYKEVGRGFCRPRPAKYLERKSNFNDCKKHCENYMHVTRVNIRKSIALQQKREVCYSFSHKGAACTLHFEHMSSGSSASSKRRCMAEDRSNGGIKTKYSVYFQTYNRPDRPSHSKIFCVPSAPVLGKLKNNGQWLDCKNNKCLNDDHYASLEQAWDQCGVTKGCSRVQKGSNDKYYIRRKDDPVNQYYRDNTWWIEFECPEHDLSTCFPSVPQMAAAGVPNKGRIACKGTRCLTGAEMGRTGDKEVRFDTLRDAWDNCAWTPGCKYLFKDGDYWYLRAEDDPILKADHNGQEWMEFACLPVPGKNSPIGDQCGCPAGTGWCESQCYCGQGCTTTYLESLECTDRCGCSRYTAKLGAQCEFFAPKNESQLQSCRDGKIYPFSHKPEARDLCGCSGSQGFCPDTGKCGNCYFPKREHELCREKDACGCQRGEGFCDFMEGCSEDCTTSKAEEYMCRKLGPSLGEKGATLCPEGFQSASAVDCEQFGHLVKPAVADFGLTNHWTYVEIKSGTTRWGDGTPPLGCSISIADTADEIPKNRIVWNEGLLRDQHINTNDGSWAPVCVPIRQCKDGIKNGNEQDVDCGGPCDPCQAEPEICSNGIKDEDEEMVDCGGPDCKPCEYCQDECVHTCGECSALGGFEYSVCGSDRNTYASICALEWFRNCGPRLNFYNPKLRNVFNGSCAAVQTAAEQEYWIPTSVGEDYQLNFFFGDRGTTACPDGSEPVVEAECLKAAQDATPTTAIFHGELRIAVAQNIPPGCSVRESVNFFEAYWKEDTKVIGRAEEYRPLCTRVIQAAATCAEGTCAAPDAGQTAKGSTCPSEPGYCVTASGEDQNDGVVRVGSTKISQEECLWQCLSRSATTGCETNSGGCYAHTKPVDRGSGGEGRTCWAFHKCAVDRTDLGPFFKRAQVNVGKSTSNTKTIAAPGIHYCAPNAGDADHRLNQAKNKDEFLVTVPEPGQVMVKRTDLGGGWGMNLIILCDKEIS